MADDLVERLRKRAEDERTIQRNNEAVAEALKPQMEAFERQDGSHNTFAVRLGLDHKKCAENDAKLASDWDEAADRITALQAQNRKLVEALRDAADGLERAEIYLADDGMKSLQFGVGKQAARAAIAEAEKGEG